MGDINWGPGMMAVMSLIALAILMGIVGGIVLLVRSLPGRNSNMGHDRGPRAILDERFARGDIDHDEYENRLRVLGERTARPSR